MREEISLHSPSISFSFLLASLSPPLLTLSLNYGSCPRGQNLYLCLPSPLSNSAGRASSLWMKAANSKFAKAKLICQASTTGKQKLKESKYQLFGEKNPQNSFHLFQFCYPVLDDFALFHVSAFCRLESLCLSSTQDELEGRKNRSFGNGSLQRPEY